MSLVVAIGARFGQAVSLGAVGPKTLGRLDETASLAALLRRDLDFLRPAARHPLPTLCGVGAFAAFAVDRKAVYGGAIFRECRSGERPLTGRTGTWPHA